MVAVDLSFIKKKKKVKDTEMRRDTEDTSITVMSSGEKIYYTLCFLCLLHHQTACDGFVACA